MSYSDKKSFLKLFAISSLSLLFYFLNAINNETSFTGFFIEYIFLLPLFAFVAGFRHSTQPGTAVKAIRLINLMVFFLSIYSMTLKGFPIKLPYKDFAPDYFNALYGLGGAKIVTIFGYFSILSEINQSAKTGKLNRLHFTIGLLNFLIPSYIIGIIGGAISLFPIYRKSSRLLIVLAIAAAFITPYVIFRINQLGFSELSNIPKIKAYFLLFELYEKFPLTFFIGTGLGQFISQAALWSSDYIAAISTHSIPNIPGFYMSNFHSEIYGPIFSRIENFWNISSSAQKPYSSLTSLASEMGFISFLIFSFIFTKRFLKDVEGLIKIPALIFIFLIFSVDVWHDNIFFIFIIFIMILFINSVRDTKIVSQ